jgi:hypothetical protein
VKSAKEQRQFFKLCFKVGKTAAETHVLRETYGADAMSETTTYVRFKHLKNERT